MVEDLAEATATEDTPLFPQDLNTTNDIITRAIDLLIQELDEGGETTNATDVRKHHILGGLSNVTMISPPVYCYI